ncbi:MAG: XRE family transcriptional regulator [Desulfuromonas sp.]|nr:MAG: XRE family transcriptional regulator [Desulfuromonas sp.]
MRDQELTPQICIDGSAIRRIREKNKLTQLYVAKVVGVTTDTVSRWENNRYPTIRRDNARLLAEALEVDLAEILLNGNGIPDHADASTSRRPLFVKIILTIILLCLSVGAYYYFMYESPADYAFSANRVLPSYAVPDGKFPVRVRLESTGDIKGMILREQFPEGWKLLQSSPPPSSLDNVNGTVRWIIKPDSKPDTISYLLDVPAAVDDSRQYRFVGEVIVNPRDSSIAYAVSGDQLTKAGPYHWADDNGDSVIDDSETLAASESVDEMAALHLSWETIEKIWDAGGYRWKAAERTFVPVRKRSEP